MEYSKAKGFPGGNSQVPQHTHAMKGGGAMGCHEPILFSAKGHLDIVHFVKTVNWHLKHGESTRYHDGLQTNIAVPFNQKFKEYFVMTNTR